MALNLLQLFYQYSLYSYTQRFTEVIDFVDLLKSIDYHIFEHDAGSFVALSADFIITIFSDIDNTDFIDLGLIEPKNSRL